MTIGEQPHRAEVALSIYDLRGTWALNQATRMAGYGGAYHVGVEVYRLEWSYGWTSQGTGVYAGQVGQSWQGSLRERLPLGHTPFAPHEVILILADLRRKWLGTEYHPLRHNCGHFSVEFAKRLQVEDTPDWLNTLAGVGDRFSQSLGSCLQPLTVASKLSLGSTGCMPAAHLGAAIDGECDPHPFDRQQDDPRVERQWLWAVEHMQVLAREAA
mmetsp:Transcript_139182/g.388343  ORF Transcript_139182/g.388343 Transcript_139182/m.388343 type:complete len:214 (-) Transcript_139182:195-836(-)|eukprot:CAMPEP_0179078440 /NCGR_PEP_ID=MMETSP0796-20121207/35128_1 /TAXON_ID=73915 /ORGANISM="Pyrodinium bahamense, Strain pbaha01" /LENGTH=213 /DNA_ID=CAMNT_0020775745 /DNA_START=51 /DNA_END=692 /DNA_ORIENTATION=-